MAIAETTILIFEATDVEATPLTCVLFPIKRNKEINNIPAPKANGIQDVWTKKIERQDAPYNKNPQQHAVT